MNLIDRILAGFHALSRWSIRHPAGVLLLASLFVVAAIPGLLRLKLRTDGHALVAAAAPEVVFDRGIREAFGIEDQFVVLIRTRRPEGIYQPETLQTIRTLTESLKTLPGIDPSNVVSLATEPGLRVKPGQLLRQLLLDPPLASAAELEQLRKDLQTIGLYTGTLVGADGRSAAILMGVPAGADRTRLHRDVERLLARQRTASGDEVLLTGPPVAEALLGIHILEDLGVPAAILGTTTRSHRESMDGMWPPSMYGLRRLVAQRLGLIVVAVVVMMLVYYAGFRNVLATLLPMPDVGLTLLLTFGLMGWCDVPVYLTVAVMPVLLTAMAVTDEMHVFGRYFSRLREQPGRPHRVVLAEAMAEVCSPVVSASLTTAIGFAGFAFSPLKPVQVFGVFTTLGMVFSLVASLTVIPALLALTPPAWLVARWGGRAAGGMLSLSPWMGRGTLAVVRHRGKVLALVVVVAALLPFGLKQVIVQDSWIDGFDPASDFHRATDLVNEQYDGMHLLYVSVDATEVRRGNLAASQVQPAQILLPRSLVQQPAELAGATLTLTLGPGSPPPAAAESNRWLRTHIEMIAARGDELVARIPPETATAGFWSSLTITSTVQFAIDLPSHYRPELIRTIQQLSDFIRQRRDCAVGEVIGPVEYLATTGVMVRPTDPAARKVPTEAEEIKLRWDMFRMMRGAHRLQQVVEPTFARSLVLVFLREANFADTARLMAAIRGYEREHLAPQSIRLGFAGDVAVSQSLIQGIVTTQLQSLSLSLAGIFALTCVMGRSWVYGLYCMLPSTLAVLMNFAVMGWLGMPLGVATSMFAGMLLGIGVDFTIHVLEDFRRERSRDEPVIDALRRAIERTGPPVLLNTVGISLGFGVLMLSQVPANARLGALLVLGLVNCFIATLLLLPPLLSLWPVSAGAASAAQPSGPAVPGS